MQQETNASVDVIVHAIKASWLRINNNKIENKEEIYKSL